MAKHYAMLVMEVIDDVSRKRLRLFCAGLSVECADWRVVWLHGSLLLLLYTLFLSESGTQGKNTVQFRAMLVSAARGISYSSVF